MMKKSLGHVFDFDYVDEIMPKKGLDGNIITYNPKDRYNKKSTTNLNKYGNLNFCCFSVNNLPAKSGVYALYEDDNLVYIGRAKNLYVRWGKTNYGSISPKNCYVGGQSTNCKVNNYIYEAAKAGKKLELYIYVTQDYIQVEKQLLAAYAKNLKLNTKKT